MNGSADRGQSTVVGVALLLALTTVAIAATAATVGLTIDAGTSEVRAGAVAQDLDAAIDPVQSTGTTTREVSLPEGTLETVPRQVRFLDGQQTAHQLTGGTLLFRATGGELRVGSQHGGLVVGPPGEATFRRVPSMAVAGTGERATFALGVTVYNGVHHETDGSPLLLTIHVTHRRVLNIGSIDGVAIETSVPGPWIEHFERRWGNVSVRDIDGDGTPSVIARFAPRRPQVVIHEVRVHTDG